jgi:YD repeat-containing protein
MSNNCGKTSKAMSNPDNSRRRRRLDLAIVAPTAAEILSGSDEELRTLVRRVSRAERAAAQQTERARELIRLLNASEPSALKAENQRRRRDHIDAYTIIGIYASGNYDLADQLTQIMFPRASRFARFFTRNPERVIREFTEREEERRQYTYDDHGHFVRKDAVDEHNKCQECYREDKRQDEVSA